MPNKGDSQTWINQYFNFLELERKPPSLEFLQELVVRHLEKVPFESLSKILFTDPKQLVAAAPECYIIGLKNYGLGGTCYTQNPYFAELLKSLGFQAELNIGDSDEHPKSHFSIRVFIDHKAYMIDFGNMCHFAGPLLIEPSRREESCRGNNRFVFQVAEDGEHFRMEFHRDGQLIRSHFTYPGAVRAEDHSEQIAYSLRPDAYFMNIFCIAKHFDDVTVGIWNNKFFEHQGSEVKLTDINTVDELKTILRERLKCEKIPVEDILGRMRVDVY